MDERRQLPRWEIKKQSKVWIPLMQGFSHCVIEDMNLKGMSISFNKPLQDDKNVRMSFTIGGDTYDFIKIEAQISWKKEAPDQQRYVYGLAFNQIKEEDKDRIGQYLNTHCYDQMKDKWWS